MHDDEETKTLARGRTSDIASATGSPRSPQRDGSRRAASWAIRVTFANGKEALLRRGGVIGRGPVETFHSKAKADALAALLKHGLDARDVITVFERSHGRRDRDAVDG